MSYRYLMDTNIISDLVKHPNGKVFQKINNIGDTTICTSIVVACELHFGAEKSGSLKLQNQLNQILSTITIFPLEAPIEFDYADIRNYLERAGTSIGPDDLLIAAHARSLGLTVVTNNVREFSRVPNLLVENWL